MRDVFVQGHVILARCTPKSLRHSSVFWHDLSTADQNAFLILRPIILLPFDSSPLWGSPIRNLGLEEELWICKSLQWSLELYGFSLLRPPSRTSVTHRSHYNLAARKVVLDHRSMCLTCGTRRTSRGVKAAQSKMRFCGPNCEDRAHWLWASKSSLCQ